MEQTINLPDGSTTTVNFPENATREQILKFVKREYEAGRIKGKKLSEPEPTSVPEPTALERFGKAEPLDKFLGAADAIGSFGSNLVADLGQNVLEVSQLKPFGRAYVDALSYMSGNDTREVSDELRSKLPEELTNFLRYSPTSQTGQDIKESIGGDIQQALESTGVDGALSFINDSITAIKNTIYNVTGSKTVAEGVTAIPAVVMEFMPLAKIGKGSAKTGGRQDVVENYLETPDQLKQLNQAKNDIYTDLYDNGVRLEGGTVNKAIDYVEEMLLRDGGGVDLDATGMAAKFRAQRVKNKLQKNKAGVSPSQQLPLSARQQAKRFPLQNSRPERPIYSKNQEPIQALEELKKDFFKDFNPMEGNNAYARSQAKRHLDVFMDRQLKNYVQVNPNKNVKGYNKSDVPKMIRTARDLGGRSIRAEQLNELFYRSSLKETPDAAAAALRTGVRNILKDTGQRKFFSTNEIKNMEFIARNDLPDEVGVIRSVGMFAGKIAPAVTQFIRAANPSLRKMPLQSRANYFSKLVLKTTDRTEKSFAALTKQVIAGKTADEAFVKYLKAVPVKNRNAFEIGVILSDGKYDLSKLTGEGSRLRQEALDYARGIQTTKAVLTNTAISNEDDEENEQIY